MNASLDKNALYLMHLLSCALSGDKPMELPMGAAWDAVYKLAAQNSVTPTCAFAVQQTSSANTAERQRWQHEVDQNLLRHALFDLERESVFKAMDTAGLAHLPLKGVAVSREYPRPEMRWMCDNDILFGRSNTDGTVSEADRNDALELRRIMNSLGFKTAHFGIGHHDSYEKAPCINMEMHHELVNPDVKWRDYYDVPWSRAKKDPKTTGLGYAFSREDAYIFCVAHMYKHFSTAGHGIRGLADEFVLLRAWGATMDRDYLAAELAKLGMAQFEDDLTRTAEAVIGQDACGRVLSGDAAALGSEDTQMLVYMLGSGTYGNVANRVHNGLSQEAAARGKRGSKARYLLHRMFPPREKLLAGYPILARAPWLQPGVYAFRLIVKPFTSGKKLRSELAVLTNKDGE